MEIVQNHMIMDNSVNIMYEFWRTARYLRLKVLGGPEPRWTCQGDETWPIFLSRTSTKWEDVITPEMYNNEL
jgi:hypothetical protein